MSNRIRRLAAHQVCWKNEDRCLCHAGKEETSCGVTVIVQRLEMQLEQDQLRSMAAFADRALIWSLRSKYAIYRPDGWRSDPHSAVSWR